jgi:hypothetical protein
MKFVVGFVPAFPVVCRSLAINCDGLTETVFPVLASSTAILSSV